MGIERGSRHPQEDGWQRLFWLSFAANIVYIFLLFGAFLIAPEVLAAEGWVTTIASFAYGVAAFAVPCTKADLSTAIKKIKGLAKRAYIFIRKEFAPQLPIPPAEAIFALVEEFITALCNSPASKLPFFQRLYYETESIEGSDACFLRPVTRWDIHACYGVTIYRLSLLRLSPERLSEDMQTETLRVLRRLIQRHLEDGSLSLGPFPITYDGTHPSLYLFAVGQDADYVHLDFAWATPENIAKIENQYRRNHPGSDDGDDQDF